MIRRKLKSNQVSVGGIYSASKYALGKTDE